MSRHVKVARDFLYNFRSRNKILQRYDNFLIISFQATCDRDKLLTPQEIIEFPCLKVNSSKFEIIDQFHEYVQPKVNRELTPFCTERTGITQEMIDGKPQFCDVLDMFNKWLDQTKSLNSGEDNIIVTCNNWQLQSLLPRECEISQIPIPKYFSSWINMKRCFLEVTKQSAEGIPEMLRILNVPQTKERHSGIDGCHNILSIMKCLARSGYVFGFGSFRFRMDNRYIGYNFPRCPRETLVNYKNRVKVCT